MATEPNASRMLPGVQTHQQPQQESVPDHLFPNRIGSLMDIALEKIEPSPFQARRTFDAGALQELARSILQHGLLTRIRVRPHPTVQGQFQLVFGERRFRASQLAGLVVLPCEVVAYTDEEMQEIGLVENIQRRDLTPLEEGGMFRQLIGQNPHLYSVRKLAEKIGKNKSYIEDRLALLRLPDDVKQLLEEQPGVSLRALQEVAKLPTPQERAPLLQQLREGSVNTEYIRQHVRQVFKETSSTADEKEAVFEPLVNKVARRQETVFALLDTAIDAYQAQPTPRRRELILQQLQAIGHKAQQLEEKILESSN